MKAETIQAITSWLEAGYVTACPKSYAQNLPKQIFAKIYKAQKWKI